VTVLGRGTCDRVKTEVSGVGKTQRCRGAEKEALRRWCSGGLRLGVGETKMKEKKRGTNREEIGSNGGYVTMTIIMGLLESFPNGG